MRHIKAFSFATGTVLVVMAFIGLSSASAVKLCDVAGTGETCPTGKAYAPRNLKAVLDTGTKLELIGALTTKCEQSTLFGKNKLESGSPYLGELSTFSLLGEDCNKSCDSVTALNLPYKFEITPIPGDGNKDGEVTVSKESAGPPIVKMEKCGFFEPICEFTATGSSFTLKLVGGNPAKLIANDLVFKYTSGTSEAACGMTVKLKATWKFTEPTAVFVTKM